MTDALPKPAAARHFARQVIDWAADHGRHDLPWQHDRTRYRVWVSEIMLQQTQVATVIPYYQRFMQSFPDVATLADASIDDVLDHWSGLGYYARGRNLHRAAREVVDNHAGDMPTTLDGLMALPGIGRSTAAAILSLADDQPQAILDGNVKRVLARHYGITGYPGKTAVLNNLWAISDALTPKKQTGRYNQAMMDMGATLCTRTRPQCSNCPIESTCIANNSGTPEKYPGKKPRKVLPVKTTVMLVLRKGDQGQGVLLERRPASGIWGGLWSLPEVTATVMENPEQLNDYLATQGLGVCKDNNSPSEPHSTLAAFRHTFSHYHLDISVVEVPVQQISAAIMDRDRTVWYNGGSWPGGIAAPMKKIEQLLVTPQQREETGELL